MIAEIETAIQLLADSDTCLLGINAHGVSRAMDYHRKVMVQLFKLKEQVERLDGVNRG